MGKELRLRPMGHGRGVKGGHEWMEQGGDLRVSSGEAQGLQVARV